MTNYTHTVVGTFTADGRPNVIDSVIDEANAALDGAGSPVRLLAADSVDPESSHYVQQMADAETMLLDWLTDAEIGEALFSVLTSLDSGMEKLTTALGSEALAKPANTAASRAWHELVEARRMLASYLRWIDDVSTRRGRAPLGDHERQLLAE